MTRRIKFFAEAGDAASPIRHEDIQEVDDDEDLDEWAWEYALESIQPQGWWEEVD